MSAPRRLPSPISLAIAAVVVVASIAGYYYLKHSVDQQETAQLQSQTTDAGATASSEFGTLTSSVANDATLLKLTGGSASAFEKLNPPSSKSVLSNNLIQMIGGRYVVAAASGAGFTPGEALSGPALATVKGAAGSGGVTTGPVTSNGKLSYTRFATKVVSGLYVYEQFAINPHINVASALGSSAFSELNVRSMGPAVRNHRIFWSRPPKLSRWWGRPPTQRSRSARRTGTLWPRLGHRSSRVWPRLRPRSSSSSDSASR